MSFAASGPDSLHSRRGPGPDGHGSAVAPDEAELCRRMREANEHLVLAATRAQSQSEEAERASHLKDDFIATISHELRTPLSAVLGWVRFLEEQPVPSGSTRRAIAVIRRNVTALAHLVDDLLDTSRIIHGTVRLALQPVDLAVVARGAIDDVRPAAAARNITLAFADHGQSRSVSGDPERLHQAVLNLLSNAIKFTPDGGRVDVVVECAAEHVELRVVDTGKGISAELLPHVFDRLRQADDVATGRHSGLGLGLGIVRSLVHLHGGTVHAASPGAGQGATFSVRLPLNAAPTTTLPSTSPRPKTVETVETDGTEAPGGRPSHE